MHDSTFLITSTGKANDLLEAGAVLEILLSSFQAACLLRMRTVGYSRKVSSDAAIQNFCEDLQFSFVATKKKKKRSSPHFLN